MTTVTGLLEGVAHHKLSVDDFHRMAEAGILKCEDRVELIEGEIIDMTPIGSGKAGKTNRFTFMFAQAAMEGLAVMSIQNPLHLYNEPEPDVMLLRPRKDFFETSG
ncbi:MAG: Uma2 family endonuclease [Alphaproteobacteria bacterium]|nr:Uma2 family endonuclease [Alphaproteobacteria bacterium]